MNWRSAAARVWQLPVVWVAGDEQPALPAKVTVVHVVHHYVPAPGGQLAGPPQQRDTITSAERHHEDVNP